MEELQNATLPAGEDGRRTWSKPRVTKAEISVVTQNSAVPGPPLAFDYANHVYNS